MLLLLGIGSIIVAVFILLGISDAGPMSLPVHQRALGSIPFAAFAAWAFWVDFGRKPPPRTLGVLVVVSFLLLLLFGSGR